jgi:hypothetical protein
LSVLANAVEPLRYRPQNEVEIRVPPTQDLPFPAPSDVVQRYRETAVGHSGRWERHRPAEMAQCGEIDVMEHYGQKPTTAFGTIHGPR